MIGIFTRTRVCAASKARQVKRGVKEVVKGIRKGEKGCAYLFTCLNPVIEFACIQTAYPCCRHQPHRHHFTSTCTQRRGTNSVRICYVEGRIRLCELNKTTHELRHDMSRPKKEDKAERGCRGEG